MTLQLRAASRTDVGRTRERNEDALFAGRHTFAVADGVGGHRAGEVASRLALEPVAALDEMDPKTAAHKIAEAVRKGNRAVFDRSQQDPELRGMATTLTAVVIHGGSAALAHVGDSRCYLFRDGQITQLSRDHTMVARMVAEGKLTPEQAEAHPQRSIVTRALGAEREVDVDEVEIEILPGDRILVCSDGLTTVLSDDEIRTLAGDGADIDEIVAAMIDEANARGGPDNITAVLVDVGGTPVRAPARLPRRVPVRPLVWAAVVVAVLAGGFFGVRAWTNRSFYVGLDGNRVAIYRGLPVEVLGVRFARVEEPTAVERAEVAPWFLPRLEEGVRRGTLAEARLYVADELPRVEPPRAGSPEEEPDRKRRRRR